MAASRYVIEYHGAFSFPAPPHEVWSAMERFERFERWWGWLREFRVEGPGLVAGSVLHGVVVPPLPYRLGVRIALLEVCPTSPHRGRHPRRSRGCCPARPRTRARGNSSRGVIDHRGNAASLAGRCSGHATGVAVGPRPGCRGDRHLLSRPPPGRDPRHRLADAGDRQRDRQRHHAPGQGAQRPLQRLEEHAVAQLTDGPVVHRERALDPRHPAA